MSWVEKIGTPLQIITGDGRKFTPLWKSPMYSVDFNLSEFEFPNQEGALVDRRLPKARRYNLDIYFEGENNIDDAKSFELSSRDPRSWKLTHPIYGLLIVQPTGLSIDSSGINVTSIKGSLIETIQEGSPKIEGNPYDVVIEKQISYEDAASGSTALSIITRPALNETSYNLEENQRRFNTSLYEETVKDIKSTEEANEYLNLFNDANSALLDMTQEPLLALTKVNNFINFPPKLVSIPLQNRISSLGRQLNIMFASADALENRLAKVLFENNAGALISAMALGSVIFDPNTYKTKNSVLNVISQIIGYYNRYISTLNLLQSLNSSSPNSYMPNATSLIGLDSLMNYTLSNLFSIASGAKQERSIVVEDDSNVILLTHRLYGLDANDDNINYMIESNGWGSNSLLIIRKGAKVLYYI